MIISVNWLKKFTDITVPIDELARLIGARLVEIEAIEDISEKYKAVVVVKVVSCEAVEGSDHLSLTRVDDGGVVKDVERDSDGYVQVVCGAPNVTAGMLAAWLPPASTVPETFGSAEPFVLGARELRGHMSNGMLASAKELDLFDDHDGIVVVDKDAAPGTSFAELYELNDQLLDIENKSLTHRPDTFGIVGFAREIAAIQGNSFTTPEWLRELEPSLHPESTLEAPTIHIDDPSLSQRFTAILLTDANEAAQSPLEMQTYLARSGVRPVSAIVDVTNYLMLLTGQPLHAYDYDKFLQVSGGKNEVHVGAGKPGEKLKLLNGSEIELDADDMVIAAGDVAVGLAGAMGGADTEIDDSTKRILLECATFDLFRLRNIQMKHGIFSEAITRLTKGVPAPLSAPVVAEAARLLREHAGAKLASPLLQDYPGAQEPISIKVSVPQINEVLGAELSVSDVTSILTAVEIDHTVSNETIPVTVPYWRNDLHIPEDIIEEIGRIAGFDSIPPTVPKKAMLAVQPEAFDRFRQQLRKTLVRAGANEVLTYSFVHGDLMTKVGQKPEEAYRLVNSLSPELQYFRQSLVPSLLSAVRPNAKAGYEHFALFELNKFHTKRHEVTEEGVPKELDSLGFVISHRKKQTHATFYEAKAYVEQIAKLVSDTFSYESLDSSDGYPVSQPFEPLRSARVVASDGTMLGAVGELRGSVKKALKLSDSTAAFELSTRALFKLYAAAEPNYTPISRYPSVERDICFQVAENVPFDALYSIAKRATYADDLMVTVAPLDMYQAEGATGTKNITLRFVVGSRDRTLTADQVTDIVETTIQEIIQTVSGKVV